MMRIESLQLVKYGHFGEGTVTFGPGLTVVYGRNEAGKSTLLDGLTDFLWGIARTTKRAYTVQPKVMELLGAVTIDGTQTTYRRRLGDLFDSAGTKVPAPWGEPADKDMWQHGFGLDHARLLAGGKLIVDGDDDPAGIEFLAETGIDIDAVRAEIVTSMEKLFKPHSGAKNVEVRRIAGLISKVDSDIAAQQSSASEIVVLRAGLESLNQQLREATDDESDVQTKLNRTSELLRCRDKAGRLADARALVEQSRGAGRCLSREEVGRLDDAITSRDQARKDVDEAESRLVALQEKEESLAPNENLLAQGPSIDALVKQVESRQADHAAMAGEQVALAEADVRSCLAALGVAGDNLEAGYRQVLLAKDRVEQLDRIAGKVEEAQAAVAVQEKRVEKARKQLDSARVASADEADASLVDARAERDQAWSRVRAPWLSGDLPDIAQREQLAASVDEGIKTADVVAEGQAKSLAAAAEDRATRRERQKTLTAEEKVMATARGAEESIGGQWVALVAETGLQEGTDPEGWRVRSDNLRALQKAWDSHLKLSAAAQEAAARYGQFEKKVAQVAVVLASAGEDPFANLERLRLELEDAKRAAGQLKEVEDQKVKVEEARTTASDLRSRAETQIAAICGDDDPAGLSARSHMLHEHEDSVAKLLAELRELKEPGSDLDVLLTELNGIDVVVLEQEQQSLQGDLAAAKQHVLEVSTERGAHKKALADVEAKGSVADLKAEREDLVGQLREAVEEYRNLYLQQAILDAYREGLADDSGTGILKVAGEYLSRLTDGRYTGFAIVTQGQKRLLRIVSRVDAGGGEDEVETSKLSTGTEYQVYFALRLAGIAAKQRDRVEAGQPTLPVVLDDVLLAYDDYRTKAALGLLAELGREFQIVVMTHSRSVLADAEGLEGVATVELAGPVAVAG